MRAAIAAFFATTVRLERATGDHWLTRFVFLRLLGVVYFVAFLSFANQALPLIGSDGLMPAHAYLERAHEAAGSTLEAFLHQPSIFWLDDSDAWLRAVGWLGAALSLVVVAGFANAPLLAAMWALYLSIEHVGQLWYGYGWEIQLLETGFLAIFLAPAIDIRPFPSTAPPAPVIWALRWLIVRIMLGAGLIKIRGDACWRDLTALYFHYETQPIPGPLSRTLHFMPHWFHQFSCLVNHAVELVAPLFAFGPRIPRRIAGFAFIGFQIVLILSGNLSFLNWLTICPALACLDDGVWRRVLPRGLVAAADRARERAVPSRAGRVVAWALLAVVAVLSVRPVVNLLSSRQVMNTSFNPLHLVNTYGAFGTVGRVRPEIVIEGTSDAELDLDTRWREYEFKAKPGDPKRAPPWISPYHYRLDWQIWFAAMSGPDRYPWVAFFLWKLLHNDRGARSLLANDPFPDAPPHFVRALLFKYRFAPPGSGAVWERTLVGEWLPPVSIDDARFVEVLKAYGFDTSAASRPR